MTTKFNKDMYAKMRAKKDKPLSNIRKKMMRVIEKVPSVVPVVFVTPVISGAEMMRIASPSTSVEELLTPVSKRPHLSNREKEKVDLHSSTVWSDERLVVDMAHGVVTVKDLKVFSGVPFNNVASRHVHKLIQARCLCNFPSLFTFYFTDNPGFLLRCWGRVSTLPLSISLKRLMWLLLCRKWKLWRLNLLH